MADVYDLDVHGVRYAEIHVDLKRDMKLQGEGFVALLDFTTVDTLRASLERVITDKTGREGKVGAMCYYKKRRRGAVTITTQRHVMLACCEYPLVTSSGKPAPDTYIRVGVALAGFEKLEYRNCLRKALGMLPVPTVNPPSPAAPSPFRSHTHHKHAIIGNLLRLANGRDSTRIVYRKVKLGPGDADCFVHKDPPPKRMRLAESMGWQLVGPSSPEATEIKPLESDPERQCPDICIPTPPSLPIEIKNEPLDMDEDLGQILHVHNVTGNSNGSLLSNELVTTDETSDDDNEKGSSAHQSDPSLRDPGLKVMWDQLRKMETRLNDIEGSQKGSPPPTELSSDEGAQLGLSDLGCKMAALEQRLLVMEKQCPQKDDPLVALEKRLAVMEKNISRTLSSVDKLSKSLTIINRKHLKTNGAVDILCRSVKKIRDSQSLGQSTLDQIQELITKNDPVSDGS